MNHLNRQERTGAGLAAGSVLLIGGSVAASSLLGGYPVLGGQAIRYLAAGLLLAAWARLRRQPLPRPGCQQKGCHQIADPLAAEDRIAAQQAGRGHGPADQQHRPGRQPGANALLLVQMIHKTQLQAGSTLAEVT